MPYNKQKVRQIYCCLKKLGKAMQLTPGPINFIVIENELLIIGIVVIQQQRPSKV